MRSAWFVAQQRCGQAKQIFGLDRLQKIAAQD
jgi:hypothetical protein